MIIQILEAEHLNAIAAFSGSRSIPFVAGCLFPDWKSARALLKHTTNSNLLLNLNSLNQSIPLQLTSEEVCSKTRQGKVCFKDFVEVLKHKWREIEVGTTEGKFLRVEELSSYCSVAALKEPYTAEMTIQKKAVYNDNALQSAGRVTHFSGLQSFNEHSK